jgi:hypothetical protein
MRKSKREKEEKRNILGMRKRNGRMKKRNGRMRKSRFKNK